MAQLLLGGVMPIRFHSVRAMPGDIPFSMGGAIEILSVRNACRIEFKGHDGQAPRCESAW